MKSHTSRYGYLLVLLGFPLLVACSVLSLLSSIPGSQPTPSQSNRPTGASPMSGDWNADTDFGSFAFTVAPDGTRVTTAVIKLQGFNCGGSTVSSQVQSLSSWSIEGGGFSGDVSLESGEEFDISFDGAYDESSKTFSGTWEEDAYGTLCDGDWVTAPHE